MCTWTALAAVAGGTLPPKLVDQPIGAERFVGVQQQHRQERPLFATDERDLVAVFESLRSGRGCGVHVRFEWRVRLGSNVHPSGLPGL